jgi:hypothetical protein
MNRHTRFVPLLAASLVAVAVAPARAEWKQVPVVRLTSSVDVKAPPSAIWAQVTTGKNLVTWCPVWKNPANAKLTLTKVGDVLDYTDEWGNGGRSVVTYLSRNQEIRIAHEPTNGSYICQAKLVLEPKGAMTHVTYVEQYTDESKAEDLQATAGKMEAEMGAALAALKKAAEVK